ncbi:cytochrome b [Nocardia seriolae]|nr:cytochrome b/b6 domain-containing protein [Nocardia seriolae]APA99404.1 hypothetical protein NS506_05358 [Nocardia seriolae]MTJ63207.1 cytochrome b [Nocardia seriolae]MTJ74853.1 cytochrome b [Nocardia seriolae]MTJ88989.1 cytochrome b [Nocardia seriolae]MTK32969.1 cytochrome b [Nocardia seriolae]
MNGRRKRSTTGPTAARPAQFDLTARILHWLMAVLVVGMLFLGAAMVGSIGHYGLLLSIHRTVGCGILLLGILRLTNRLVRRAPVLSPAERRIAMASELSLYALLLVQPVLGWALVSASGIPVRIGSADLGFVLPGIAPESAQLYAQLRTLHAWAAYLLLALFTAHMCAVLWHVLVLRDGLLRRMLGTRRARSTDGDVGIVQP